MTTSITIGMFKGGVGKTTASSIFSYLMQKNHFKTLLVDCDPQANATEIIKKTFKTFKKNNDVSFAHGIKIGDLSQSIAHVNDYLDIIPSTWELSLLPDLLENENKSERPLYFRKLLKNILPNYDYVIFDTPPQIADYTSNAILSSDYVLMVLQSQQQAYSSSIKFVNYLKGLIQDYNNSFDLLGVIPYLVEKHGPVDNMILKKAKKLFGKAIFHNQIYSRERVKRFGMFGITDKDMWDKRTLHMYKTLLDEILARVTLLEG